LGHQFETLYADENATGLANFYTENGMVLPPGSEMVQGREKIRELWEGLFDLGIKKIKLDILEVEQYGDTATEVGKATLLSEDGQIMDKGKYIVIWKQQDGQWKIHRDIFNSSLTPPSV
jgi:uncharacterized protein (TIGR02246 family)